MSLGDTQKNGRDAAGRHRRHVRVGALCTLALLLVAAGAGFGISRLSRASEHRVFSLFFEENVSGLLPGSKVRAFGVPVGKVESIRLRPPHETEGRFHAEVRVALDLGRLRHLGLHRKPAGQAGVEHIAAGLCAKLILLSPLAAEYGVELVHGGGVPAPRVTSGDDVPPAINVLPGFLSGEKLTTYADALAEFSRNDFAALEHEWDATLDHWLAITSPGAIARLLDDVSQNLARAEHLLDVQRARARHAGANAALGRLRHSLAAATGDAAFPGDAMENLAAARASMEEVCAALAETAAALDGVLSGNFSPPFTHALGSLRRAIDTLNAGRR
ncbi:MAG: MlaD family protein [Puniceicoccales bacterium]|jgi:ABC-type transporter Mla subunit MlaD|nr:MlaD family protein [Puniceicoccales bacterium]